MKNYTTNKENEKVLGYETSGKEVVEELKSASSRISDLERSCYRVDNCDCPSCVCHKSKVTLPIAPAGIAAATPVMIFATAVD